MSVFIIFLININRADLQRLRILGLRNPLSHKVETRASPRVFNFSRDNY